MMVTRYLLNAYSVVACMLWCVAIAAFSIMFLTACSERTSTPAHLVAFDRGDFIAQSVLRCDARGIVVPCIHGITSDSSIQSVWHLNEDSSLLVPLLDDSLGPISACASGGPISAMLIQRQIPRIAVRWTPEGSVDISELPVDLTLGAGTYRLAVTPERSAVHIMTSKALYTKYRSAASWRVITIPDSLREYTMGDIRDVCADQSGNLLVAFDAGEFGGSLLRIEDAHDKALLRCIVRGRPVSVIRRTHGSSFIIAGSRQHMRQSLTWIGILTSDSIVYVVDQETMRRAPQASRDNTAPLQLPLPEGSTVTDVTVRDNDVLLLSPQYGIYRIPSERLSPRPTIDRVSTQIERYQSWSHKHDNANGLFLDNNRVLLQYRSSEAYIVPIDSGSALHIP